MLLLDVNVLVQAHRADLPDHGRMREWLAELQNGELVFAVPGIVFSAFIRTVTRKPFDPPATVSDAFNFCNSLMSSSRCLLIHPGDLHWGLFDGLCRRVNARGNLVTDAYLAAMALERGDILITLDQDFGLFPDLKWRGPFDSRVIHNPA